MVPPQSAFWRISSGKTIRDYPCGVVWSSKLPLPSVCRIGARGKTQVDLWDDTHELVEFQSLVDLSIHESYLEEFTDRLLESR